MSADAVTGHAYGLADGLGGQWLVEVSDQYPEPAGIALLDDLLRDRPEWVETIETARNTSGPGLVALCRLLDDEGTPPALREIARRFVDARLYRAERPRERSTDPETSKAAGKRVAGRARPGGAVHRILQAYRWREEDEAAGDLRPKDAGFTSAEVEDDSGVRAAHKRTSELLADGLLRVVYLDGDELVRDGGRVLTITEAGREELARLDLAGGIE